MVFVCDCLNALTLRLWGIVDLCFVAWVWGVLFEWLFGIGVLWLRFVCLVNLGFAGGDLVLFGVVALWLRFVLVVLCGVVLDAGWV